MELQILEADYRTWASLDFGICSRSWKQCPVDTEGWLCVYVCVCVCMCVCLVPCSFIIWVSTVHHCTQDTEDLHHHRIPGGVALLSPYPPPPATPSLQAQFLILGNHQFSLHFYHFVISRMLHEWNHMVYNLWRVAFLTQHNSLNTHPSCCISVVCTFLWLSSIPYHGRPTVCWTVHLLKAIWAISSFWLLWIKLLWTFLCRFLCEHMFSFLWDKCPWVQLLTQMVFACLVLFVFVFF